MCARVRVSLEEEGLRKRNEKYLYLNESSIINIYWIQSYLQGGDKLLNRYTNGRVETTVQLKHAALWCGALLVLGYLWNLAQVLSLVIPSCLSSDKTHILVRCVQAFPFWEPMQGQSILLLKNHTGHWMSGSEIWNIHPKIWCLWTWSPTSVREN